MGRECHLVHQPQQATLCKHDLEAFPHSRWHDVTAREVYEYSPWLRNTRAVNWSEGAKEVVRQLKRETEGEGA